ncbi:MotA/TolQ/ExbB proton channel family protein [Shewanella surugensis]|uniref:MotA/TolQ/ExbB proton channel family protein n=1 Tax=Shewanella surugensis TaxID=212020 RepID=A0ABT0L9Z0_9GAMM|nr:MotA/TolQ/ExbB proton channel family protein [Shewanella surugensis]MCL1124533.1 MotA/TolQ/ExbB proton channel family protein [Shewanella surugensis]
MNDSLYQSLNQALGSLTWPLGICAFITFMIILERLALLIYELSKNNKALTQLTFSFEVATEAYILQSIDKLKLSQSLGAKGARLLLTYRHEEQATRENIVSLWLSQQQNQRKAGLKLLQLIAAIAPLMGLLGTVLGLIDMFGQLAQSQGPITPSQLSAGLGLAMNTTAAGLIIALPAIISAHLFNLWAEKSCDKTAYTLNQINLWLNGVPNIMHLDMQTQLTERKPSKNHSSQNTLTDSPLFSHDHSKRQQSVKV